MTTLTTEQIESYATQWGIRVKQVVAKRFLSELDTDKTTYIEALHMIHSMGVSTETIIALEYILLKLYDPKPGYKGKCGEMWKPMSAVDGFLNPEKSAHPF